MGLAYHNVLPLGFAKVISKFEPWHHSVFFKTAYGPYQFDCNVRENPLCPTRFHNQPLSPSLNMRLVVFTLLSLSPLPYEFAREQSCERLQTIPGDSSGMSGFKAHPGGWGVNV